MKVLKNFKIGLAQARVELKSASRPYRPKRAAKRQLASSFIFLPIALKLSNIIHPYEQLRQLLLLLPPLVLSARCSARNLSPASQRQSVASPIVVRPLGGPKSGTEPPAPILARDLLINHQHTSPVDLERSPASSTTTPPTALFPLSARPNEFECEVIGCQGGQPHRLRPSALTLRP